MTHLGSIEGHGLLIIEPGGEIGVHYQIDVFQAADDKKLATGNLRGDQVALARSPASEKAVLELSNGHRLDVVIVEIASSTARINIRGTIPGF